MKKVFAIVSILALSACWSGGKLELWEGRNTWIENMGAYDIEFFNQEPKLLSTEMRTVKDYAPNKVKTAYKGYSIANVKTYKKEIYASSAARINMDGGLASSAAPISFKKNEQRQVIGLTTIDGVEYYLIPSDTETFVFLINDDGSFYKNIGQIRNNKLRIIDTTYFAFPEDLRFEPVTNSSAEQSEPIKGFDLRFDGLKDGKAAFMYFDYSGFDNNNGSFKTYTFPNKEVTANIRGTKVKILFADDQKLDYMIVE